MAPSIRRDLYSEVTSHILAELERGAAPWIKPWSATPGQNVPQNAVTCSGSLAVEVGQRREYAKRGGAKSPKGMTARTLGDCHHP
jgi:antirestriction protein ArdC